MTIMLIQHQLLANSNRTTTTSTTLNKELERTDLHLEKAFIKEHLIKINRLFVRSVRRPSAKSKEQRVKKNQAYLLSVLTLSMNRAMRYYRLWIYTCNAVLLVSVICFIIIGSKIIIFEPKRMLIPNFNLTQPSLIYAYSALFFQSGFLQFIGCVGAIKLNEKLLNIYWLLLLLLLFGDIMLGIFWVYRYKDIMLQLGPDLKYRLVFQYPSDKNYRELWDQTQIDFQCCGVDSFQDYILFNSSYLQTDSVSNTPSGAEKVTTMVTLPSSCCFTISAARPMAAALRPTHYAHSTSTTTTTPPPPSTTSEYERDISLYSQIFQCPGSDRLRTPYKIGCHDKVAHWIKSRADILFILGFCVISFLKLCFLGILRYEIREMIQKIKILQEKRAEIEAESVFAKPGPKHYEHNGGVIGVAKETSQEQGLAGCQGNPKKDFLGSEEMDQTRLSPVLVVSEQERERPAAPVRQQSGNIEIITTTYTNRKASPSQAYMKRDEEEDDDNDALQNTPLLSHSASSPATNYSNQSTKSRLQRSFLSTILNHHDYGNDSDTNSHCALLITDDNQPETEERKETEESRKRKSQGYQRSHSNGNNNSYEMKEMNQRMRHSFSQSHRDRDQISPPSQI